MDQRIFISVASFCDPVLFFTLGQACARARWPERLHFGVIDQSPASDRHPEPSDVAPGRLSCIVINPLQARGPCWARALAMSLYDGEDWFFQIDSHMDFEPGWDARLLDQARQLQQTHPDSVISSYPHPFDLEAGQPVHRPTTTKVLAHVLRRDSQFAPDHAVLNFEAHPVEQDTPLQGFHLGAGCLMAPGHFVQRFPYDPYLYFHGEEQALALRLFTHGWTIFHTPGLPVYHLYNSDPETSPARPLHWDEAWDAQRAQRWWVLEQRSRRRLDALLNNDAALGVYGLGASRTLADYAAHSGIDYGRRLIADRAYRHS